MGFYSEVQITACNKACEMFAKVLKEHKLNFNLFEKKESYGIKVLQLDYVKWYPEFPEVKAVDEVCKKLNEEEYTKDNDYAFKMVILNEDNTTEEYSNEVGATYFCDVVTECYIKNPYM